MCLHKSFRLAIVELVKTCLDKSNSPSVNIEMLYGAYISQSPTLLTKEEFRDILLELSSPLTGYLGNSGDGFYFLRHIEMK